MEFDTNRVFDFIKYRYMPEATKQSFQKPITVYHGTYPCCFARILHTARFACSDWNIRGSDCRWPKPAVFTADTLDHVVQYAWPGPFLKDNLYYGLIFELEADATMLMNKKEWSSGTNKHSGEMLFPPEALRIRYVYLLCNLDIAKGKGKCQEIDQSLELLPFPVGGSLRFEPQRRSTWSTWENRKPF